MPPRLAHKKSRKGCQRCKARRVKCDETHPACSNCSKHGVSCEYTKPYHQSPLRGEELQLSTESNSSLSPARPPTGVTSPYSDTGELDNCLGSEERRELELRLLHHFMTVVVYTFPACNEPRFRDLWIVDTVRIGFEHPFLFNAILAISSLHLLSDTRPTPYFYATDKDQVATARVAQALSVTSIDADLAGAHRIYLNMAIRQQRGAISDISPANADAIFMTSLLLAYQSLNLISDGPTSPYSPPVHWLRMAKAIYAVVEATRPMIQNASMIALFLANTTEPDFKDRAAMFNPHDRQPFEALLDWAKYPESDLDWEVKEAYEDALAYVGGVYRALLNKEAPRFMVRRLVTFGVLAPTRYISLLEQGRPRALVILAHHFALSQAVDEHWWFHGAANRVVTGIQSILPAEWQWAMEWPLSMIHVARPDS